MHKFFFLFQQNSEFRLDIQSTALHFYITHQCSELYEMHYDLSGTHVHYDKYIQTLDICSFSELDWEYDRDERLVPRSRHYLKHAPATNEMASTVHAHRSLLPLSVMAVSIAGTWKRQPSNIKKALENACWAAHTTRTHILHISFINYHHGWHMGLMYEWRILVEEKSHNDNVAGI